MNNPEDFASDTDDSDCDFDPKAHDSHAELSEEDEDDILEETKVTRKKTSDEPKPKEPQVKEIPEVDVKKADDLWASFQSDVKEQEPASSTNGSTSTKPAVTSTSTTSARKPTQIPQRKPPTFPSALKRSASGGLGNILGQLGKKNKVSVLEQSKKDWNSFKDEEGLKEELETYNKGKDG